MDRTAERALIERCLRGEQAAWDALFQQHYAAVGRFIFQLSPSFNHEDTEEICQETFLSVIKNLGNFGGRSALQTWICRIAANKSRDYSRKQMATKRGGGQLTVSLQLEDEEGSRLLDPPSDLPAPDAELMRGDKWKFVGEALEVLGGPCREILELRYFGDLSYKEISEELDLNEKTVSSRLSKCHNKLGVVLLRTFWREPAAPNTSNK